MQMIWYKSPHGNVGDDLNPWIWPRLFGDVFEEDSSTGFAGIGSILINDFFTPFSHRIVFGSGVRWQKTAPNIRIGSWDVRFVRGPLSARVLGGVPWISDPAILAPIIYGDGAFRDGFGSGGRIGYVRYFLSPVDEAASLCKRFDLLPIDPTWAPERFIDALRHCRAVICEAMHGAILADAFRVPWVGIRLHSDREEGPTARFKWRDWVASVGLPASAAPAVRAGTFLPRRLRFRLAAPISADEAARRVDATLRAESFYLSDASTLRTRQDQILAEVDRLKMDLNLGRA